jgi:hypothetical protein
MSIIRNQRSSCCDALAMFCPECGEPMCTKCDDHCDTYEANTMPDNRADDYVDRQIEKEHEKKEDI